MNADAYEFVATVDEVPEDSLLGVTRATGEPVCLVNYRGQIHAVADRCTHQEFQLSLGAVMPDGTIQCAWHGARFDCVTGQATQPPAELPLPVYAVKVEDGRILVGPMQPGAPS